MNRHAAIASVSRNRGFSFVEILAAMLFMGIVVPVIIEGLQLAGRLSVVSERKRIAAQLGSNLLTEKIVTGEWLTGAGEGTFETESGVAYRWTMQTEDWTEEGMFLVVVEVSFQAQGSEYRITLHSLVNGETS